VGPGGIGKTRLALAAMAKLREAFADGVHLVSLAPVGEAADIVPTIANALGLAFFGSAAPIEQLLSYLAPKQLLLVVDNFEHLLEEAALLSDILARAPQVTLLATSRERLKLREEWVYAVPGLALPPAGNELTLDWARYSAVELFTQRARQTAGDFAPTGAEMDALIRICRLVEGMPLALELAAPWTRTLSCHEIADEIQYSLDFLSTPLRNVPERHRSIGVVFEQTWQRLPAEERSVLQRLSVFRGGCTRTAAEAVAGATLPVLSSLQDKALVRRTPLGRYELHELIRQFAGAQLQADLL
jgi:predicted ATPase